MDNLDRDIKMTNATIQIRDDDVTLLENGNTTTQGIMARIKARLIQFGSGTRDQDLDIVSANGGIHYDAGLGTLVMTTTPIIGSGQALPLTAPTILTSNAGYTMSAAQMISGLIVDNTGTGGIAATLPTVAAFGGCNTWVGSGHLIYTVV